MKSLTAMQFQACLSYFDSYMQGVNVQKYMIHYNENNGYCAGLLYCNMVQDVANSMVYAVGTSCSKLLG